jgi:hypothetical protein
MVIAAAEPAEVRQLLIIRSLVLAVSNSPVLSSTYGASAELAFRGVPQNVPCENLLRNAHNNKGWALSTARLRICRAFAWHVPDFGVSSVFQNPLPAFRRLYWNARLVTARTSVRCCPEIHSYRDRTAVCIGEYGTACIARLSKVCRPSRSQALVR